MVPSLHDHVIYAYSVLTEERRLVLHTESEGGAFVDLAFGDVVAYEFRCVLEGNVIFEVEEGSAREVVDARRELFRADQPYGWPALEYADEADLVRQLEGGGVVAYWIVPSYGLSGWVLAKGAEVARRAERYRLAE